MVMLAGKKIIRQKSFQFGSMENLLLNFKSMIYNDKKMVIFFYSVYNSNGWDQQQNLKNPIKFIVD